jgi:probable FeS assembly SUF system protein SufT
MQLGPPIQISRECDAIEIPDGVPVRIPAGTEVRMAQALGGSYTVMSERGVMWRISGENADALGLEEPVSSQAEAAAKESGESLEERILAELRTCYDPEMPVNIVDLGLVHSYDVFELPDGSKRVDVTMTLTAPGCGMGEVLKREVEEKLARLPGVSQAHVEIDLSIPLDQSQMSEAARLELGLMW